MPTSFVAEAARDRDAAVLASRGIPVGLRRGTRLFRVAVCAAAPAGLSGVPRRGDRPNRRPVGSRPGRRWLARVHYWFRDRLRQFRRSLRGAWQYAAYPPASARSGLRCRHDPPRSLLCGVVAFVVAAARCALPPSATCLGTSASPPRRRARRRYAGRCSRSSTASGSGCLSWSRPSRRSGWPQFRRGCAATTGRSDA